MTKQEYQGECLVRNPQFCKELLAFRRRFPILFDHHQLGPADRERFQKLVSDGPIIEARQIPPAYVALSPTRLVGKPGIFSLFSDALVSTLCEPWEIVGPRVAPRLVSPRGPSFKEYCSVLVISPTDYLNAQAALRRQWPQLSDLAWEPDVGLYQARHPAIVYWDPPNTVQEVILGAAEAQALKHMHRELLLEGLIALESFRHAKLYVPIYPDTRKEDLDWKQIGRLQKKVYRTKRRAREDKYEKYLSAFDLFHEKHKSPNQIARILGLPLDQVRRAIRTAYRDILGQTPEKRTGATFEEHSKTCPHFKAGQMCKHCNRLLNADVGLASDWRERRVRGGIADTLYNPARGGKHIRKKQASFPEDEVPAK